MIIKESLSERRFPGYAVWFRWFYGSTFIGAWFCLLATSSGSDGAFLDFMHALVFTPLAYLLGIAVVVIICKQFISTGDKAVLNALTPFLPLFAVAGIVDWLLSIAGLRFETAFVSLFGFALNVVSFGLFPIPIASIGTLLLLAAGAWFVYSIVIFQMSGKRALFAAACVYGVGLLLLATPSFIAWLGLSSGVSLINAAPVSVERGLVHLSNGSFWWTNLYERFPFASNGEADWSVHLLKAGLAFIALAIVYGLVLLRSLHSRPRVWLSACHDLWLVWPFALVAFGWGAFARFGTGPVFRFPELVAIAILLLTIASGWLASCLQNDLQDIADDEQNASRYPIASGNIQITSARTVKEALFALSFFGSFLLGWPICAAWLVFCLSRWLYDMPPFRIKYIFPANYFVLGVGNLALVFVGWLFGSAQANTNTFPAILGLTLLVALSISALVKDLYQINREKSSDILTIPAWLKDKEHRKIVAAILAAGYIAVACAFCSWIWLAFAFVIAVATLIFMFTKPFSVLPLQRLLILFYVIGAFLAASFQYGA